MQGIRMGTLRAALLAVVLAIGLAPAAAFAVDLTAGATASPLTTQDDGDGQDQGGEPETAFDQYDLQAHGYANLENGFLTVGCAAEDVSVSLWISDEDEDQTPLTKDDDYEVIGFERLVGDNWGEASGFDDEGRYRAVINGKSPYHGTVYAEFEVYSANDLAAASVEVNNQYVYGEGTVSAPSVTVTLDGKELEEGTDYEVSFYDENENTYTVENLFGLGDWYGVLVKAKGDHYIGQNMGFGFSVNDAYDLSYASFDLEESEYAYTHDPVTLSATVKDALDKELGEDDYEFVYFNADGEELHSAPVEPGSYSVGVKAKEGSQYREASDSTYSFSIIDTADLSFCSIDVTPGQFAVGHMPDDFDIVVRPYSFDFDSDLEPLQENVDYQVSYERWTGSEDPSEEENEEGWEAISDFDGKTEGKYRVVIVKAEGSEYHGVGHSGCIEVLSANDVAAAEVCVDNTMCETADGTVTPEITVTLLGQPLEENKDYSITYLSDGDDPASVVNPPLRVGHYFGVITGIGEYTGTFNLELDVNDAYDMFALSFDLDRSNYGFTDNPVSLMVNGPWPYYEPDDGESEALVKDRDYELVYSDDPDAEDDSWTTDAPKDPGRHYVKAHGIAPYHGYTEALPFDIYAPKSLELAYVEVEPWSYAWTGDLVAPKYSVVYDDGVDEPVTLKEGIDYKTSIHGQVDAGYYDETKDPIDIGVYAVVIDPVEGSEYSYADEDNLHVWGEFRIVNDKDLANAEVGTDATLTVQYTGGVVSFKPDVISGIGDKLIEGRDFKYEYFRCSEDGDCEDHEPIDASELIEKGLYAVRAVEVEGGDYFGESHCTHFYIGEDVSGETTTDLSGATVDVAAMNYVYNGQDQTPDVSVSLNGQSVPSTAYSVSFSNNRDAGTATVTVTGKDGYTGTATATFTIAKATLAAPGAKGGLVYNGKAQTGVAAGAGYSIKGNSATNAGSYTATLTADANHAFAGGKASVNVAWSIGKATLAEPGAKGGLVYNGKAQTGVAAGAGYSIKGNSATNAGNYSATLTADANHAFAGGKAAVSVNWSIAKAQNVLSVKAKSKKAVKIKVGKSLKASKVFKVAKNKSKGKVTYKKVKGNKKIVVAKNGTVKVKKGLKKGTYTIKVKATSAATKNYKAATTKTFSVKVTVK